MILFCACLPPSPLWVCAGSLRSEDRRGGEELLEHSSLDRTVANVFLPRCSSGAQALSPRGEFQAFLKELLSWLSPLGALDIHVQHAVGPTPALLQNFTLKGSSCFI